MSLNPPGLPDLGRYRALCLYIQSSAEASLVRRLSVRLRQARQASGLDRQQLAATLGVDLALVIAVENGYGSPAVARGLVQAAEALSAARPPTNTA